MLPTKKLKLTEEFDERFKIPISNGEYNKIDVFRNPAKYEIEKITKENPGYRGFVDINNKVVYVFSSLVLHNDILSKYHIGRFSKERPIITFYVNNNKFYSNIGHYLEVNLENVVNREMKEFLGTVFKKDLKWVGDYIDGFNDYWERLKRNFNK
jgi:hypothetical protein